LPAPLEASNLEAGGQAETAAQNTQIVVNGGMVNIVYDLSGPSTQTFDVALEISEDGGRTYALKPRNVTGDVGSGVAAGTGKRIVWDAAKDTDNLQLDTLRFRISAQSKSGAPPSGVGGDRVTDRAQVATRPAGKAPASPTRKGRNSLLWPGMGLIGGGVLISGMAQGGPLKKQDPGVEQCASVPIANGFQASCYAYYADLKVPNTALVGAGLGIAGGGALLMILGHRHAGAMPSILPLPGGFFVTKTVIF
jgi:hypothetical protein